ncbi:AMP-binding protein [Streptomyces sp. NPDC047002]|uniref:AMP-binding protein n=1 Tax=Streptomyces sp. NPDC047002 TaxID=3155475 RepID=UPI0034547A2A
MIFTSGSTGAPKGVAVPHQAAPNTCTDVCYRFGIGADDAVLGLSSLSFDLSVFDVFGVLGAGGRLVLPRPGAQRDPEHWLELAAEHGVTVWNSVPAVAEMVVSHLGADGRQGAALPGVRVALWSGDWIPVGLPDRWRAWSPGCRLISLGGATGAAIWSIAHEIGEVDPEWDSIPYGRLLTNQRFHVLDDRLEHCPVWVAGELYIGGLGLAEGYWRDHVRTAERFITHPVSGERLYRTGDLGRWRPDGTIEFLGRTVRSRSVVSGSSSARSTPRSPSTRRSPGRSPLPPGPATTATSPRSSCRTVRNGRPRPRKPSVTVQSTRACSAT